MRTLARPRTVRPVAVAFLAAAAHVVTATPTAWAQRPPPDGSLDGIYTGLRTNLVTGRVAQDYFTFFPDGRVLHDDPPEGLAAPLDWAAACRANQCGSYALQGRALRIRWQSGSEETFDREPDGALKKQGRAQRYRPVAPLDDLRLEGTYAVVDAERNREIAGIDFTRDGRFAERSLMRHTSWTMLGDRAERARTAVERGGGRYAIRRNTLELRYDGGPVARFVILVPPGAQALPQPEVLHINRNRFPRVRR